MGSRAKAIIIVVVVLVVVVIAAVVIMGGNKKTPSATTSTDTMNMDTSNNSTDASNNPSTAVSTDTVAIENFAFSPSNITVKVGSKVTWTNKDSTAHTVTADSPSSDAPASGTLDKGQSYSFTFNKAGTYSYHCTFHSNMTATVTVTE